MTALSLGRVESHSHTEVLVRDLDDEQSLISETYQGVVAVGFTHGGGHVAREQFTTLIPIADNMVRAYDVSSYQVSALVSLVTVQGEDEGFFASIDSFDVYLEEQTFPGAEKAVECLVLVFSLGVLSGTIHRVGYTVTVVVAGTFDNIAELDSSVQPG